MRDAQLRRALRPPLERAAVWLARNGVTPLTLTGAGLLAGAAASTAAAVRAWPLALALWLLNRAVDGLDGPLARRLGVAGDLGGMLDFLADVVVYAGFIVGVAIALAPARVACVALLATYFVNSVALLSFAAVAERRRLGGGDERTLRLDPGLAEGAETILAYCSLCLFPGSAAAIAWAFAGMVALTALQRTRRAARLLRGEAQTDAPLSRR